MMMEMMATTSLYDSVIVGLDGGVTLPVGCLTGSGGVYDFEVL